LSYPGNSGGPLYVLYNGYYYPAAIYLGTLYSGVVPYASAVRAIDSQVVSLITNAQAIVDNGGNSTGGGVINFQPNQALSTANYALVQVLLGPPSAVLAGGGWRLAGDSSYGHDTTKPYTREVTTNDATIEFKPLDGWISPTNQTNVSLFIASPPYSYINVISNAVYTVTNPMLLASRTLLTNRALVIGMTGTTGTVYQLQSTTNLAGGLWTTLSTNSIVSIGTNWVATNSAPNRGAAFYRAVWLP
jgi:hypothetical protein